MSYKSVKISSPTFYIAGATFGDSIIVRFTNNQSKTLILENVTTFGIEGFDINILNPELTFYPYHNIISVQKTI